MENKVEDIPKIYNISPRPLYAATNTLQPNNTIFIHAKNTNHNFKLNDCIPTSVLDADNRLLPPI